MIQCRCFKCNSALETEGARHLGLGETCEANVKAAFEIDREQAGSLALSGDQMFALFALFGATDQPAPIQEAAFGLISLTSGSDLTWEVVKKLFVLARTLTEHGRASETAKLFAALKEIAPRMTAMALGQASPAEALLDYSVEDGKVTLSATTVRQGSEELCKLASVKRHGTRQWTFDLRDAPAVQTVVGLRWPFARVTVDFLAAVEVAKTLPPLPPPPAFYESYLATDFMVVAVQKYDTVGKRYLMTQNAREDFFAWMRNEIGAAWYSRVAQEKECYAWLVPAERIDEVKARLDVIMAPPARVAPRATANRRAYR